MLEWCGWSWWRKSDVILNWINETIRPLSSGICEEAEGGGFRCKVCGNIFARWGFSVYFICPVRMKHRWALADERCKCLTICCFVCADCLWQSVVICMAEKQVWLMLFGCVVAPVPAQEQWQSGPVWESVRRLGRKGRSAKCSVTGAWALCALQHRPPNPTCLGNSSLCSTSLEKCHRKGK